MSENGQMGKGKIVGIERDNGMYYLLREGAPTDTRTGHAHRLSHQREATSKDRYRAALDIAYKGGAGLTATDCRIYFQCRHVTQAELDREMARRVEVVAV